MSNHRGPVLVGVDGSPTSVLAASWGYAEARSRAVPLHLISAYPGLQTCASVSAWNHLPPSEGEALKRASEQLLAENVAQLVAAGDRGIGHDVAISTYAVDSDPRTVMLERAHTACTIVLGSRRHGVLRSALLGSLGTTLTAAAPCPVVVLRWSADLTVSDPAVVVGVQSDVNCEDAIGYAFDYASRHRLPLRAVLCWRPSSLRLRTLDGELDVPSAAQAALSEAIAGWREKYPDVSVHENVVLEHPIEGLLSASKGQRLLVVGKHASRAMPGLILGSVSQGVLHHATCPVAVVA